MATIGTLTTRQPTNQDVISLARRRGILYPSYEIYGGVAGFYDWGPMGTLIKNNFQRIWREAYVLGEGFHEIDCPNITPEIVFRASGHLGEFTDYMTACRKCGQHFRADHLLQELHPNPDTLDGDELLALISEHDVKCPECKGDLAEPFAFNLMFGTNIGPTSDRPGYLRPETAQGMFLNFRNLFLHNRQKLPLGVVQLGKGFRNEISPRQGVIRVREFNMAELELFVDPEDDSYHNYPGMRGAGLRLLADDDDKRVLETTVGKAVDTGMIANRTLAYFMGLTQELLVRAGLDPERIRFRQHEKHEMAHYARDCWDAEALIDFGWVELVGIADRSCYDLEQHMKESGIDLRAARTLEEPRSITVRRLEPLMARLGPAFRGAAGEIKKRMEELEPDELGEDGIGSGFEIDVNGEKYRISPDMFELVTGEETISVERFVPYVIEPSYGVDRILYAALEHSLDIEMSEEGEETRVLRLPPRMAPYQFAVFPLMSKDGMDEYAGEVFELLKRELGPRGYHGFYDESGSIGRRYSRMDEIGCPFCITIDYQSREDQTFTLRESDSKKQVRIGPDLITECICCLVEGEGSLAEWALEAGIPLL